MTRARHERHRRDKEVQHRLGVKMGRKDGRKEQKKSRKCQETDLVRIIYETTDAFILNGGNLNPLNRVCSDELRRMSQE